MADIQINPQSHGRKKLSTRIDLTPMVDLGFLLITFFIFTTTLTQTRTLDIVMPVEGPPIEVADHTAMTVYLGSDHKIYYLCGKEAMEGNLDKLQVAEFGWTHGIREVLMKHKVSVRMAFQNGYPGSHADDEAFVLIKASSSCSYSDVVNMLDELEITQMRNYALLDLDDKEEQIIASKKG
ncbi:MAG: biopolymer transporter ExbD [Chitinophagaceae bacterium]|nr:biopolymer transporter ExbD [Chitinophagaceae bacterium]